jgi:hypothetical protein
MVRRQQPLIEEAQPLRLDDELRIYGGLLTEGIDLEPILHMYDLAIYL